MVLSKIFGRARAVSLTAAPGERVYAIGDVHGCRYELDRLLGMIDADSNARDAAHVRLILLGDLVDRGPDSAGVVARARQLADRGTTTVLAGNHEELLLLASRGEREALSIFNRFGGRETLVSYGVDPDDYDDCALAEVPDLIQRAVPAEDLAFLAGLAEHARSGDYIFVHAGVRPGVPLHEQTGTDLRWIREPFLSHKGSYGAVVVHGHTITPEPDIRPNRIGIDTGAYESGILTAIGIEGEDRWFLQTGV
jgi:serine/threonine protein phosphatase 1